MFTLQNLEKVLGDAPETAAHQASRGTPLRAAHDMEIILAEWHLTMDGGG